MTASTEPPHRTWAEIDAAALRHNLAALKSQVGSAVRAMAVVKANAYGHGVNTAVSALTGHVEMFGVANLQEALAVRNSDAATPVFILGPALPGERRAIVENGFIPAVSEVSEARDYATLGSGEPVSVHLALDTGMGRIGIWQEEAVEIASEIVKIPGLRIAGIGSHLPVADEDEDFTHEQLARFHALVGQLRGLGIESPLVHVANSAGIIAFGAQAGDMIRAGLALYGSSPIPEFQDQLHPALTWKTRVTLVREVGAGRGVSYGRTFITAHSMRIATLAVGYADGFQRHLSNQGADVLIGGHRCPVLGRVTMDQIMADVSALESVAAGDEAVILGRQGNEEILAAELAQKAGTIPWEIFTSIGSRVVRIPAGA